MKLLKQSLRVVEDARLKIRSFDCAQGEITVIGGQFPRKDSFMSRKYFIAILLIGLFIAACGAPAATQAPAIEAPAPAATEARCHRSSRHATYDNRFRARVYIRFQGTSFVCG